MNPIPEVRPTRLADARVNPPVFIPATVVRYFPPARLSEVEAVWSPARQELAVAQAAVGLDLESSHWNWMRKVGPAERGELTLFAIECEGEVQGLMAVPIVPRPAVLTSGQSLLYVDYLESAPWNQQVPGRPVRFRGAGRVLIATAILMSEKLGLGGRVGLHSLSQAEQFYESGCRMTRLGPDAGYHDLVYFEYAEGAGAAWLDEVRIPG